MKCYNHHDADAVAICRNCYRALCPDCVAEAQNTCACRNRCEERVATLTALINRSKAAQKNISSAALFPILLGLALAYWGVASGTGDTSGAFLLSMGILFILWGLFSFVRYMRATRQKPPTA